MTTKIPTITDIIINSVVVKSSYHCFNASRIKYDNFIVKAIPIIISIVVQMMK